MRMPQNLPLRVMRAGTPASANWVATAATKSGRPGRNQRAAGRLTTAAHGLLQTLAVIVVLCVAPGGGGDLVEEVRGADLEQGRVHAAVRPGDRQERGDAGALPEEHLGLGRIGGRPGGRRHGRRQ